MDYNWRSVQERKKRRGSQTPGKGKPGCQASMLDRMFAKKSRSYKHKDYRVWCDTCDRMNKRGEER